ncbi:ABC transporter ATP-binding protein [Amphibacillus cookii]|uniref:ABC transporter ATP-binding protein n=1 Tax=Amphibacillus cookii TaxID=767787 RepID=UPI001958FD04|nr:ABC transporter ATP-binding protein [Amphibacillus cookii]MBM7541072.1 ABC-2 type transport system ATP-binding protein [Amphibacillus cookii]
MLDVGGLTKAYRQGEGIFDIHFQATSGTIVGIIGANGAGKTTLLRCIAGLLKPDAGSIEIAGNQPGTEAGKCLTAFVPDQPHLFPSLTVVEHIQFKAKAFGVPSDKLEESVGQALEAVGLSAYADRTSGSLSKGQKQKVMLASAYQHQAQLFVLDEPTNGLDIPSRQWLAKWLVDQKAKGKTILVSSHSLDFIKDVADSCLMLRKGKSQGVDQVPQAQDEKIAWGDQVIQRLGGAVQVHE